MSGFPVVIAANSLGFPVKPVTKGFPVMTLAANGRGVPIVISDKGTRFVVEGLFDSDAIALFDRMTVEPDVNRKAAISTLVTSLKSAGIWAKLDALYVLAAHDAQAARLNWVQDAFNLTPVNAPVFTVDRGYKGDGVAAYLESGFNPTVGSPKFSQNSNGFGAWCLSDDEAAAGVFTMGSTYFAIEPFGTGKTLFYSRNASSGSDSTPHAGTPGLYSSSRDNASTFKMRRNGTTLETKTKASVAPSSETITILKRNGATALSTNQIASVFMSGAMSDQEAADFYAVKLDYLQAVGAVA